MPMNFWQRNRVKRAAIEKSKISKVARPIGWFVQGYTAFRRGEGLEDCPYKVGTADNSAWVAGWKESQNEPN